MGGAGVGVGLGDSVGEGVGVDFLVGLGVERSVGNGVGDSVGVAISILLLNTSTSLLLLENIIMEAGKKPTINPKTKYFTNPVIKWLDYSSNLPWMIQYFLDNTF